MANETALTPTASPLLFGRYRISERLGDTRLAVVYAAVDERLQRRVLLHLMRKELVGQDRPQARFVAEISQMARRSHPALLEVFDSGEAGGRPFMVTEHGVGRPLRGLGLLTVEQALLYLRQVAGAVAVCQARQSTEAPLGLYHPPISSSNVLVVDEGRVKLVESWQHPSAEVPFDLAHYRAPELSEGRGASPASAVYALGILLYELLTGERPIHASDARTTALAHLTAQLPPLRQARPSLYLPAAEQLVARATARAPEHRFPDAQTFGEALDRLWRDLGSATRPLAPVPGRSGPARRRLSPVAPELAGLDQTLGAPEVGRQPDPTPVARPDPAPPRRPGKGLRPSGGRMAAPATLQRQSATRNFVGWVVMLLLILGVAAASYMLVGAVVGRLAGLPRPVVTAPGLPGLPTSAQSDAPDWLDWIPGGKEEIFVVNIADGLNIRRVPDASDTANVITVVPNGTPVRKLEGPRIEGGIPWLRVSAEVDGRQVEGWMSMNYLLPKE